MNIIFLGGIFTQEKIGNVIAKSKGVVQFAANALQWNIINGLDENNEHPIRILNAEFMGSFPKLYTEIYIKGYKWEHCQKGNDLNIGFLNLFGIKHLWRALSLSKHLLRWVKSDNLPKTVIIYSMHTPFLFANAFAKFFNKNITTCLIVPDLPEFMNLQENKSYIFTVLKAVDKFLIEHLIKYADCFVLLTKHMKDSLNIEDKPYVIIEGMVNPAEIKNDIDKVEKNSEKRIILYTGTLNKAYGIMQLIEAFKMIEGKNYSLWICGDGEAKLEIIELSKLDSRICYFGQISRDEVIDLQNKASVLINPRGCEGEFTKYSFPSKIMEYLLSGTPSIIKALPGIPEEYYKHVYLIEDDSIKGMAQKIIEVCTKPQYELDEFGKSARDFVIGQKNYQKQTKKIISMINSINRL